MERLRITSESLFKWTVFLFAIPTVPLLLVVYLVVMLGLGGGWAYGGGVCRYVMNPLGMLMLAGLVLGVFAFLFFTGRRVALNRRKHRLETDRTRGDN